MPKDENNWRGGPVGEGIFMGGSGGGGGWGGEGEGGVIGGGILFDVVLTI